MIDHGLLAVVQKETARFFKARLGSRSRSVSTDRCSAEDVQKLFLDQLVLEKDCVFCLAITAARSPIDAHVMRAGFGVLKHYRQVRNQTMIPGRQLMRPIDTRAFFFGSGRAIVEATRFFQSRASPAAIRERLTDITNHSYAFMLPRDLYHLHARVKAKGDRSVSLFGAVLGSPLFIESLLRGYRG